MRGPNPDGPCTTLMIMVDGPAGCVLSCTKMYRVDLSFDRGNSKNSHIWVVDYDEACFMHLTPGVVHNFPKAVGV